MFIMKIFDTKLLTGLYSPAWGSSNEENGQVTIIGGSSLFHGAPILALKAASRVVDMVFFASPESSVGGVAERLKAELSSFILVPWEEVDAYIEKSDAVLIGPGMMRFTHESRIMNNELGVKKYDREGNKTREITKRLLLKFPHKKWVIDAGSLQTIDNKWIPNNAILTPNAKELEILFRVEEWKSRRVEVVQEMAKKHNCIIVAKGSKSVVCSPNECVKVTGGNPGLTKGGSGDVLAGLTVALLAKNEPFLAACAASYIEKAVADELYKKVGVNYNSDDLAEKIPETFFDLMK